MSRNPQSVVDESVIRDWVRDYQMSANPVAMARIVAALMPMISHLARKYPVDFSDDLIQEGCMGLMQGVQRFDLGQSTQFATFAYHYIRGRMRQFLATKGTVVRHPHGVWILCESLDTPVFHEDESVPIIELLQSPDPSPEDRLIRKDIETRLHQALCQLSPKEQAIVFGHFWNSEPLESLGARLEVSRETARRIGLDALKKIRQRLLKRQAVKGVLIQAVAKRPVDRGRNKLIVVSEPQLVELDEFPILHFVLSSRNKEKNFIYKDVRLLKRAMPADGQCLVRVSKEIDIRSIIKMVRILALYLKVSRKNIAVELVSV
ncbi:MAG: sigma-70 family RNA polymerase sigma factor [Magnetococcales bacterium]|nr:sigma-70 family RNA polymerase sigma factor [Magnetococcales bacterium]